MFPDITFKTAIHAVAVSEMPAADRTDGRDAPDAATGSAGIDASMPPRVAADIAGASPVHENKKNAAGNWPNAHRQLLYQLAPGRQHASRR